MKKSVFPILNVLCDAILICIAVLSVPCSVLTAYEIPFPLVPLIVASALIGICLSLWMHLPKYGFLAGIVYGVVFIPLLFFRRLPILYGFRLFRYAMLDLLAPDVPFLPLPDPVQPVSSSYIDPTGAVGWFTLLIIVILGLAVAWSLIRSRMILLPLIVPLPIFMLSLIYTDLPIAYWTVFLLMVYLGSAMVSGGLRIYETERYGLVTIIVLCGMILLGTLIFVFSPPEDYEPLTFEQRQEIASDKMQGIYENIRGNLTNRVKRTEDLTDEEEWLRTGETILEVQSSMQGETYLRAYSLGIYRDNSWRSVPVYGGAWKSMAALGNRTLPVQTMLIHAEGSEMCYTPYGFVPEEETRLGEAFISADGLTDYAWRFGDSIPEAQHVTKEEQQYIEWALENYGISDRKEKAALKEFALAEGLVNSGDNYETAQRIAQYIRTTAKYSTEPGKLPRGEDFVLYFLKQSRKGYCVHFATATTALLQSLDIPARYVFGYRYYAVAGEKKTVTDEMAHAWTEVYCPGIGWVMVESTAGAEGWKEPEEPPEDDATPTPENDPGPTPTPEPSPEPTEDPDATQDPGADPEEPEDGDGEEDEPEQPDEPGGEEDTESSETGEEIFAKPEGGDSTDSPDAEHEHKSLWWLLLLLIPPALIAGLWGLRSLARNKRQKAFRQKDARAAILEMYRYQKKLQKHGAPESEKAYLLAEEAAFSNHPMTEDRRVMQAIVKNSVAVLEKSPPLKRLAYRWLLFLL